MPTNVTEADAGSAGAHDTNAARDNRLVVAISSRALFDLGDSHALFERDGLDAYRNFQIDHENEILKPGVAFPLVQKLLGLNKLAGNVPPVEVILLSRNSGDTGLRIFNAIQHYGLEISRAAFTSGAPTSDYIAPFKADLFLSANAEDVGRALAAGVPKELARVHLPVGRYSRMRASASRTRASRRI